MITPDFDYLEECFEYLPTGILIWKERPRTHFSTNMQRIKFNKAFVGKDAGLISSQDVIVVNLLKSCPIHRIVWKLHTNEDPNFLIHKNGVKCDNMIENLTTEAANYPKPTKFIMGTPIEIREQFAFPDNKQTTHDCIRWSVQAGNHTFNYLSTEQRALDLGKYLSHTLETRFLGTTKSSQLDEEYLGRC